MQVVGPPPQVQVNLQAHEGLCCVCVQVCMTVYVWVRKRVCASGGWRGVHGSVLVCDRVQAGVRRSLRVCMGARGFVRGLCRGIGWFAAA